MTLLHSIILGAVEGITEFLPISSTAHLMIAAHLLHIEQSAFVKSFEIVIQLGAICAVLFLYIQKIKRQPRIVLITLAGFVPTAIVGFVLYKFIKTYLLGNFTAVFWSMLIGGIVLIGYEIWDKRRDHTQALTHTTDISYTQAAIIGTVQAIAVIPGVSRSAATILAGRFLGMNTSAATEFSFLLAVPTIVAAAGYDLLKSGAALSGGAGIGSNVLALILGFVVSFITALLVVRLLTTFVRTHSFMWFGVYRILAAVVLLFFVLY